MRNKLAAVLVGAFVFGVQAAPAAEAPTLGAGGYVVFLPQLGPSQGCRVDRALAERLRGEVRGVPIGRVVAAPGCTARTSARLVFGRATVSRTLTRARALERVLNTRPPSGTNTVVVAPPGLLAAARGLVVRSGEAYVLLRGGLPVVRVRADGWHAYITPREPQRFSEWSLQTPTQSHPHDIWPVGDGTVWYTAQFRAALGRLNTTTGASHEIPLGAGAAPHGVITDEAGNAWVTDQGLDAIVRVDRVTEAVTVYRIPLPQSNPNTATFDRNGVLWFTGAGGSYGRVDPRTGHVHAWPAPRGPGPYGITATPNGDVYFVSLVGGYLGRVDPVTGAVTVLDPPTRNPGTRRVWSDSRGRLWVTESFVGKLALYDPAANMWREWELPGRGIGDASGHPYAVAVDAHDKVWVTDFTTNAILRFDPETERWQAHRLPTVDALVRQIVVVDGVLWGAESAREKLVAFRLP